MSNQLVSTLMLIHPPIFILTQTEITESELLNLLSSNELLDIDPVAEAFKAFDPKGTGTLDTNILQNMLSTMGYKDISDRDLRSGAILCRLNDIILFPSNVYHTKLLFVYCSSIILTFCFALK
jgi:hypothetical protein